MLAAMTSDNIKTARAMLSKKRDLLCVEANVPPSTWSRAESYGQSVPKVSVDTLMSIERIFLKYGIWFGPQGVDRCAPFEKQEAA